MTRIIAVNPTKGDWEDITFPLNDAATPDIKKFVFPTQDKIPEGPAVMGSGDTVFICSVGRIYVYELGARDFLSIEPLDADRTEYPATFAFGKLFIATGKI